MKITWLLSGFFIGFIVASVIGLVFVAPMLRDVERVNIDSDVHRPLRGALDAVEESMAAGDCERAKAQLRLTIQKFDAYREARGSRPEVWWHEIEALALPATAPSNR